MRKRLFIGLLVLCIAAVTAMVSYRGYKAWRHSRFMRQTRQFLTNGDVRNALLSLQQAVRSNPSDIEACRLMADFAELSRSPGALPWRQRVVQLEPGSLTNRLLWAKSALALGDLITAGKALDSVNEAGKQTAAYHKTAGALATAAGRLAEAETHFREASRLEPENLMTRMNLAVLRLQAQDPETVTAARTALASLRTNATVRCEALRHLTVDAARRNESTSALAFVQELLQDTNAVFGDRLLHLDALRQAMDPHLPGTLAALQKDAETNAAQTCDVARWLLATGAPSQALTWIRSLPAERQTNQPIPMIVADCHLATSDWEALLSALDKQSWGELETLRLVYRTRALKAQHLEAAAKADWAKAVKTAGERIERLTLLLRSAHGWNWLPEQEEILWLIVNRYPKEKWAFQALAEILHATGKTRSLLRLFSRAAELDPQNLPAKNNLAMLALLLDAHEKKPCELAKELYEQDRKNPFFVSTYSFALHLQAKNAEAERVLERLTAEQLEDPTVAAYYGIILEATGHKTKAKQFLDLATKARLLPEEQKLVDRARTRI